MTKEEFMTALKEIIGERNDDTVLSVLEYLKENDAPTDHAEEIKKLTEQVTQLTNEKTEIENNWRTKYREAFFSTPSGDTNDGQKNQFGKQPEQSTLEFENLFSEIVD